MVPYTRRKSKPLPFYSKKIIFDFKKEFDKVKEKGRGKVAKGFFGLTFDGVRDNKDSIKRKTLSLRKRERVIIIY